MSDDFFPPDFNYRSWYHRRLELCALEVSLSCNAPTSALRAWAQRFRVENALTMVRL